MTNRQCVSTSILADYLGERAAALIVQVYGGHTIKTPRMPAGEIFGDLKRTLGDALALAFLEVFRGEHVYIALDERSAHEARLADLVEMRRRGMSYAEIARTYRGPPKRYSERWVRQLLARVETEGV